MRRVAQFGVGFCAVVLVGVIGLAVGAGLSKRPAPVAVPVVDPGSVFETVAMPEPEPVPVPVVKAEARERAAVRAVGGQNAPPPRPIMVRNVDDLYAAYVDPLKADMAYKGKEVEIAAVKPFGVGQSVVGGAYYLKALPVHPPAFGAGQSYSIGDVGRQAQAAVAAMPTIEPLPAVRLELADDERTRAIVAGAPPNSVFRVRGRVLGRIGIGPGPLGYTVIVEDCRILAVVKAGEGAGPIGR